MDISESERVLNTDVGHLARELREASEYFEHIKAEMYKLKDKAHELQEEDWKTLTEFRNFVSRLESALWHLKKTKHDNPIGSPELVSLHARIGYLIQKLYHKRKVNKDH